MQMCPSWPKEHDWKSCKRQPPFQEFESLHLRQEKSKHNSACSFLYNQRRFEKGNAKHRNSPGDCFGTRVRAGERKSEPGESLHLRQEKSKHNSACSFLYNQRRFEKQRRRTLPVADQVRRGWRSGRKNQVSVSTRIFSGYRKSKTGGMKVLFTVSIPGYCWFRLDRRPTLLLLCLKILF